MGGPELPNLLERAGAEIERQRRRLEVLEAVNRTVEIFGGALFTHTGEDGRACVDIAWELQNTADALRVKARAAAEEAGGGGHTV